MTTLSTPIVSLPTSCASGARDDFGASPASRRELPSAGWPALNSALLILLALLVFLFLAACGPAPRTGNSPSATQLAVAPPPAPKTLESTLRLDSGIEEIPFYPQIAESTHGDTVAVWEQFDGAHYNIWGNSRRAHQGWGRASLIQTSATGHSYNPRVAINANGEAAAVWVQMNAALGTSDIWSSRLEPGAGWGAAVRVEADNIGPTYAPQVAIDDLGHVVAAWQQSDGRHVNVRANRFVPGVGWGKASRLEHGDGDLGAPQVATDAGGNAMVVWPRFYPGRSALWASRYVAGSAWDKAMQIDTVPGYVHTPLVTASATGSPNQFTVLWDQQEDFRADQLPGARHYQPGRGWRAAGQECTGQLQALATRSPEPYGPGKAGKPAKAAKASKTDSCY